MLINARDKGIFKESHKSVGRVKAIFNLFFFENESPIKIEKKNPHFMHK
jgi:hypothetical protein